MDETRNYAQKYRLHTGVVRDTIFKPFGSVVILVLPGSTSSDRAGGIVTPGKVKSGG
jgi:hypothetical protein